MPEIVSTPRTLPLHRDHRRSFAENRYVYPVVSRRSKGVSIGVNLNPDKVCNFDCVYCQVDRTTPPTVRDVDVPLLLAELEDMLERIATGELFESEHFRPTPPEMRRLNDIAFSGDGEPTSCLDFPEIVIQVAEMKRRLGHDSVKLVLITNAALFHRPRVREALTILDANQGEIWAKLDAGTEAYYRLVDRTTIPFARILDNLASAARVRPLVIQSLFARLHGEAPPAEELSAFCDRLNDITRAGGRIQLVQVYTVARQPAESWVSSLTDAEMDGIAALVRQRSGLATEAYYGRMKDEG